MATFKIDFEITDRNRSALNSIISDLLKCKECDGDPVDYANSVDYYGKYIDILGVEINKDLYNKSKLRG